MSSSLGAIGSLPEKLRSLVCSSNQLPEPLKDEIKLLIEDLEGACTFLLDLSRAEAPHTMVKLWRNEVCEMSYDLEDYIDKMTHPPYSNQFEVEEFGILVELARDACKSYHSYHLGRIWPSNPSFMAVGHGRIPVPSREETYIVGIDDARRKLISLLRDSVKHEQGGKVVAIHGPAGVGKTTLAQEMYREIGGEFDCRAFVRASRMPDTRRLLLSIISQIQRHQRPSYACTVQKLIDSLSQLLQHKSEGRGERSCCSKGDLLERIVGQHKRKKLADIILLVDNIGDCKPNFRWCAFGSCLALFLGLREGS